MDACSFFISSQLFLLYVALIVGIQLLLERLQHTRGCLIRVPLGLDMCFFSFSIRIFIFFPTCPFTSVRPSERWQNYGTNTFPSGTSDTIRTSIPWYFYSAVSSASLAFWYELLHRKIFLLRHCGYFEAYLVILSRFNFPSLKVLVIAVSSPNAWLFSFVYFWTVTEKHSVHGLLIFSFLISSYSSISLQVWQSFSHFALCVLGVGTSIFTWENFVYS